MSARRLTAAVMSGLLLATTTAPAEAITLARITRRGYIVVDEPEAVQPYEGSVPTENTQDTFDFIAQLTQLIADIPGAPRARYVAVMQTGRDASGALAFYLGLRNDVRGIGQRSPINNRDEVYDLNRFANTSYPVTGFVWLNRYTFYTNEGFSDFGKYLICTQEFGHRFGTFVRTPPQPTGTTLRLGGTDAGVTDAGEDGGLSMDAGDATETDASDDASVVADASPDAAAPMGPDLLPTSILGRQTAHWSYFVHSEGSPMEGNFWNELSPGVFRSSRPSFKFHPLDLYIMGLLAPQDTRPAYLISEPDVMGQRDSNGQRITPASAPEFSGRSITIRGRRVDFGIDDIIRANGPRIPAAVTVMPTRGGEDGGVADAGTDGGTFVPRPGDLDVVWVLLTTQDRVGDRLVRDFDFAIENCSDGYSFATDGRSELLAQVTATLPTPDAGPEAGDATADVPAPTTDATTDVADAGGPYALGGGCACRTSPTPRGARWPLEALVAACAITFVFAGRSRFRRARRG